MAESFAFAIADRVLGKLGSALIQEVGLAWGVKTELEELNDTLSTIRAVLLDAEEKQATSHQLRDWLESSKMAFMMLKILSMNLNMRPYARKWWLVGALKPRWCR
ncbi:putative disease resistance protein RGA4 isoform X3 [Vitis riparia]|uniref:putative disease resistance protein RGA4 isoform X3 n=1 Tax=Vitis riparia TaxID=96939 RepID=UPI00155A9A32|nr:putative disease resistance protein RGA4 isoform X3 [Vitis riparia]